MYVSCAYVPSTEPTLAGQQPIVCTDDKGVEWHLTEDSQLGDYLAYLDAGGTVEPAEVPVDQNITAVPDTLFGGKTIREALSGQ